ncbi:hypothetical protein LTR50_004032 [Elasticomyces elasticus]|nr:hypothetical protein LTR50_004032 [Elasticomyces elasticus]
MAFGVLFDFKGSSNASRVITAADMVKQSWFTSALNYSKPIDLFVLIGHNPIRPTVSSSTFATVFNAIRAVKPDTPVQMFGGHSHIRDFVVYDDKSTALESGRYCETLGWMSMTGLNSTHSSPCNIVKSPRNVPNPTMKAKKVGSSTETASAYLASSTSSSNLVYSRRYLDWNRLTFEYHAAGSQVRTFDTPKGLSVSANITASRKQLNLTSLYGCAPQTWCQSCAPFLSSGNIFSLLQTALSAVVVNASRAEIPRLIIINTGSIRFDLVKGPFTYDDSFIVSPFADSFQYLPNVPYSIASKVLAALNAGPYQKHRRDLSTRDFSFSSLDPSLDSCLDPPPTHPHMPKRSLGRVVRRQSTSPTPGYTTTDDFGSDGDDTPHSKIPYYAQPNDLQANASFPADGSMPQAVDLVFLDYIAKNVLQAVQALGLNVSQRDVSYYLPEAFTTNSYLPAYAQKYWQANVPTCPVGLGVGFNDTS